MTKQDFIEKLKCFLGESVINDSVLDLNIPSDVQTCLLYNTDDLWLNKKQFDALMDITSSYEALYIAQNDSDETYRFDLPMSYDEYSALNLYSVSFIASDKFDWVIVIDECLESGIGILIGASDFIKKFNTLYPNGLTDVYDLISFHYRDQVRNPKSIQNLIKLLSFVHTLPKKE
ncbi:MAG: hypothetical protein J6Q24_05435 [Clostridia bacterium]|nr:hypothetical protein [Clostridia bacterium]